MNTTCVGRQRHNPQRGTIESTSKRRAEDYKEVCLNESLYHPPKITIEEPKPMRRNSIWFSLRGQAAIQGFIPDTMLGIEYSGRTVSAETTENPRQGGRRSGKRASIPEGAHTRLRFAKSPSNPVKCQIKKA
jgi:hypothetical protein